MALQQKLEHMIRTNRLETFYPANKLQAVLQRLNNIDFRCITQLLVTQPLEYSVLLTRLRQTCLVSDCLNSAAMVDCNDSCLAYLHCLAVRCMSVSFQFHTGLM